MSEAGTLTVSRGEGCPKFACFGSLTSPSGRERDVKLKGCQSVLRTGVGVAITTPVVFLPLGFCEKTSKATYRRVYPQRVHMAGEVRLQEARSANWEISEGNQSGNGPKAINSQGPAPRDPLPPARLKVLQPHLRAPAAGDQAFRHLSLQGTRLIQTTTPCMRLSSHTDS